MDQNDLMVDDGWLTVDGQRLSLGERVGQIKGWMWRAQSRALMFQPWLGVETYHYVVTATRDAIVCDRGQQDDLILYPQHWGAYLNRAHWSTGQQQTKEEVDAAAQRCFDAIKALTGRVTL